MAEYDFQWKILLVGDPSTGKEELCKKYADKVFIEDSLTIGVEFYRKIIYFQGKKIKLQIWDLSEEERFRFLLPQYCKEANAAFFLYDITNYSSLDHLPDWTHIIREHSGDIPIILVGTKLHLQVIIKDKGVEVIIKDRQVSAEEGMKIAKSGGLDGFIECSVETGENVEEVFETIARLMIEQSNI